MPAYPRRPWHVPHLSVKKRQMHGSAKCLAAGHFFGGGKQQPIRLPEGSQVPDEARLPDKTQLPKGYQLPKGSQLPDGTRASSTGTTPRQMKAGSEHSPSGTTSLTPREAARFSAARKRSRLILAAWA
ncbi:hypothetical protein QF036_004320 [Arthrobacter globiformis]|nr:hypothetical protein [Arthrobacter globiformis]